MEATENETQGLCETDQLRNTAVLFFSFHINRSTETDNEIQIDIIER